MVSGHVKNSTRRAPFVAVMMIEPYGRFVIYPDVICLICSSYKRVDSRYWKLGDNLAR